MSVTIDLHFLDRLELEDLPSLPYDQATSRLQKLREFHFSTKPAVCVELASLMTEYLKASYGARDPDIISARDAGLMYKYILENKQPIIERYDLLAGTTTSKGIGVLLHPDMAAMTIWPELETISRRKNNPFDISEEDIDKLNFEIFPYWLDRTIQERARKEYNNPGCQQLMERIIFFLGTKATAIAHTIPNYGAVVDKGLLNIIEAFKDAEEEERHNTNDQHKIDFFQGVQAALEGILAYAQNLSREARRKSQSSNDEYAKISQVCARVPAHKPESFREAVNAAWICHVALHQESINFGLSLGRLDQVLYPAFQTDLDKSRREGREKEFLKAALELVGCLWLKLCDHVPLAPEASEALLGGTGANQAVTLGGVDAEGRDAVNDLTYVMLRATELLKVRDPNVNARYHPGVNSPEYLERLCQVNIVTKATPCFHNDKAVIETLMSQDVSEEDARDYGIVGCVEPESSGRTFGHHGAISLNLPAVLELALFRGKHRLTEDEQISPHLTPSPEEMTSFDDFKQAFQDQLQWLMKQAATLNNNLGKVYQKYHPFPMLSGLMEDCLDKGKDVIQGGARYNFSGFWIIGLAEVVDSLTALEKFGFQADPGAMQTLMQAIRKNWRDEGYFQATIRNDPDKFGADSPRAKANAEWLMRTLHQTAQSQEHYRGGKYIVGYYTMTSHAGYGVLSKALPSGRLNEETFPSGITPVSGAARDLNAVLHFVANLDHTYITNGQALNLKYPPGLSTAPKLAHCIEAYFGELGNAGGMQVQCNIIDCETLKAAQQDPDSYRELFVRVSGYSAYFVDLNENMQKEIITRAEYEMACSR